MLKELPIEAPPQKTGSEWIAPDCRGMNFFRADPGFQDLLKLYMPGELRTHLWPHLERLGGLAGGRLDELAEQADKHPPVLHARDRFGRDEEWIEYHPAYREMEKLAWAEFGLHAMAHRAGVLDWPAPFPPIAKYAFQYLFTQGEFGLMCPVSVTETSTHLLVKFGDEALKARYLPRLLSQDMGEVWNATQFMTEKAGGSDVGANETVARQEGGEWRLYGEKWFCSHADADLAMILARPEGAPGGTAGLGLFLMPRTLEDGTRNRYRIVRLKDKLGTKSMASGEIRLEGALAYPVGRLGRGIKQMMHQVNLSRLSHGVRAAAMMRRCLNEALAAARGRTAFGRSVADFPLMRRQLVKLLLPTEQAQAVAMHTAYVFGLANEGDAGAEAQLRILTPLVKLRACRDNIRVATGAMEARGGNGYIEDWANARLVRDGHLGVLWEGTSNINALDVISRAVARQRCHEILADDLLRRLEQADAAPGQFRGEVAATLRRAVAFADEVARRPENEKHARAASAGLYNAASAALLAWQGAQTGDGRRLLLARLVLDHRLSARDPLALGEGDWEEAATDLLLADAPVPLDRAAALVAAA
jgi:alkylation response protein AidB-like acyl-CoA dehydrogenase